MHYTTAKVLPESWVSRPGDHGRKKINIVGSQKIIYLKDSELFEIELFNPTTESVLAIISINGKPISESGLIIRPGRREYLDCFLDSKKKFKFSTYEVEDSKESKEAIAKNGLVEISFFKEQLSTSVNLPLVMKEYYPVYYPVYYPTYPRPYYQPFWYSGSLTTGGFANGTTTTTNINYSFKR